ncbi:MAG TPA: hypothetical protein VMS55_27675 [Myxococcota bacterium]|nr:hypothetical protein [Myxococcota bacterium]
MKRALFVLLTIMLLVAGAIALSIDRIAGSAIERGSRYALGVDTHVGFVHLAPLAGELRVNRLRISNPPGFDGSHFLAFDRFDLKTDLASLRGDVVRVPLFRLQGVDLSLERKGTASNTDAIFESLEKFESKQPSPAKSKAGATGPERRYVVSKLEIRDVTAHVEWNALAAKESALEVHVDGIELSNPGGARGLTLPELSNVIVKAVLDSVRRSGKLPVDVAGDLAGGLRSLERIPGAAAAGMLERASDALRDAGAAIGKGIDGLLGTGDSTSRR